MCPGVDASLDIDCGVSHHPRLFEINVVFERTLLQHPDIRLTAATGNFIVRVLLGVAFIRMVWAEQDIIQI